MNVRKLDRSYINNYKSIIGENMNSTNWKVIFILIVVINIITIILYLKSKKEYYKNLNDILISFKNNIENKNIPKIYFEQYEEVFQKIQEKKDKFLKITDKLEEYKNEQKAMYTSLISKTLQLESTNKILEKRVANISDLNSLTRGALSIIEIERSLDIILDAYFILTGIDKIILFLWEDGVLNKKKVKGEFELNLKEDEIFFIEKSTDFTREKYDEIYSKISQKFILSKGEVVIETPLVVKEKELGVIYIIETKKNRGEIGELDEEIMLALSLQISISINNAQNYRELLIKERLSQELEMASHIQREIIPKEFNSIPELSVSSYFAPAKEMGGDYYDYYIYEDGKIAITIGDASGKGIPAAFLMAVTRSTLRTLTTLDYKVSEELSLLNKIIYNDISDSMFITVMHTKFSPKTSMFKYSNAGHNPILYYNSKKDTVSLLSLKGVAVGFVEGYPYIEDKIKLGKDDILFLYTDGVTELANEKKELYGVEKLKEKIYENRHFEVEKIKENILISLKEFRNKEEQSDDITFVILKKNT
jgi:sigma-B regulation protein RsbU (phosphoserine phosphatase)